MSRRETLPVIPAAHLEAMRAVAKAVPHYDWRNQLTALHDDGIYKKGRYDLRDDVTFGPTRGRLHLFVRVNIAYSDNFSTGLAFTDLSGNGPYRLIRCNGFHPEEHENYKEGSVIRPETPHIHRATERYTSARKYWHDHYAEETEEYDDLTGAIEHMASLVNLQADGRLYL